MGSFDKVKEDYLKSGVAGGKHAAPTRETWGAQVVEMIGSWLKKSGLDPKIQKGGPVRGQNPSLQAMNPAAQQRANTTAVDRAKGEGVGQPPTASNPTTHRTPHQAHSLRLCSQRVADGHVHDRAGHIRHRTCLCASAHHRMPGALSSALVSRRR